MKLETIFEPKETLNKLKDPKLYVIHDTIRRWLLDLKQVLESTEGFVICITQKNGVSSCGKYYLEPKFGYNPLVDLYTFKLKTEEGIDSLEKIVIDYVIRIEKTDLTTLDELGEFLQEQEQPKEEPTREFDPDRELFIPEDVELLVRDNIELPPEIFEESEVSSDQKPKDPVWGDGSDQSEALVHLIGTAGQGAEVIFKDDEETEKPSEPEPEMPSDGRP